MDAGNISIIIFAIAIVFYVGELLPIPIIAMLSAAAMVLFGVIPANTAWAAFSQDSVLVMAGIMVVGSTLFSTGAAGSLADMIIEIAGGKPKLSILLMLAISGVMSFVLGNTACTVIFLPLILGIVIKANDKSVYEQKYMQILTIITSVGGLMTLVGSPVNISASGMLVAAGYAPFTFTQFAKIALPMFIVVLIYAFTVGDKFADMIFGKNPEHCAFVKDFIAQREKSNLKAKDDAAITNGPVILKKAKYKKTISTVILLATIGGLITQQYHGISLGTVAILGGLACVITGCITLEEMYHKIDWGTLLLLGGTIGSAAGLANSGGGKIIAEFFVGLLGSAITLISVFVVLSLISFIISQLMSNTASVGVMIPIGVSLAAELGMNPLPVAIGITLCASCSFITPMASPTQALVINWGSYRFMDYVKYSGPISVLLVLMVLVLVPILYPLI